MFIPSDRRRVHMQRDWKCSWYEMKGCKNVNLLLVFSKLTYFLWSYNTVCDDNCKEVILSPESGVLVCTISGFCSDNLLIQTDPDADMVNEEESEPEAEIFTGRSRLGTYLSCLLFRLFSYLQHISERFCNFF